MKKIIFMTLIFIIFIFFTTFTTTFVVYSNYSFTTSNTEFHFSSNEYTWPLPEYQKISSHFGLRISPTTGASKYHSGIDIPAPERHKNLCYFLWNSNLSRI